MDPVGEDFRTTIPLLVGFIRSRLGPTRFWSDIELTFAALEAVRVWQCMTGQITRTFKSAPQGLQYEPTPGQIARPVRVTFGGAAGELDKISLWELDEGFVGWEGAASGAPSYWAHNGFTQMVFYPRPTQSLGEISIDGVADIVWDYTAGVELKELSPGDMEALMDYAQYYLSFKEGAGELSNTEDMLKNFYARAAAANARLRRTNFYRAAMGADNAEVQGSRSQHRPEGAMR